MFKVASPVASTIPIRSGGMCRGVSCKAVELKCLLTVRRKGISRFSSWICARPCRQTCRINNSTNCSCIFIIDSHVGSPWISARGYSVTSNPQNAGCLRKKPQSSPYFWSAGSPILRAWLLRRTFAHFIACGSGLCLSTFRPGGECGRRVSLCAMSF